MIELLRRADGATIVDLTQATGWLAHTTRAAITGLRKRGYAVTRERSEAGESVHRISDAPASSADRVVQTEAVGGRDLRIGDVNVNQTISQIDLTSLPEFIKAFSDRENASKDQLEAAKQKRDEIAADLKFTEDAVEGFFQTLGEQNVPSERLTAKLIEIASQFEAARRRLAALDPDDPATKTLVDQAQVELNKGRPDAASALLQRAEDAELAAAAQARAIAQQASAAADYRQLHAAKAREGRGDIALTQLRYGEAAGHFGAAASLLPASSSDEKGRLLWRQAHALYRQGDERGDNAALRSAVDVCGHALAEYPRSQAPLGWAQTQNNLGNALQTLGERESGTARLEEAVAAYRAALEERTRARVPLDWARTQTNLGNALWALGRRESGTARLEEAVAAHRAALEEYTRERVPLDWAMTQHKSRPAAIQWTSATTTIRR
jgi:tetratricopeptide (TPR) repeat protein